jgi:hypothetical protein
MHSKLSEALPSLLKHRSRRFDLMRGHDLFFNVGCIVLFLSLKCLTCGQNKHNILLNFPQCLSILLLQTIKTENNALDIDAIYNLKLKKKKHNLIQQFHYQIKCKISKNNVNAE